jgi:hypothetical protein
LEFSRGRRWWLAGVGVVERGAESAEKKRNADGSGGMAVRRVGSIMAGTRVPWVMEPFVGGTNTRYLSLRSSSEPEVVSAPASFSYRPRGWDAWP